MKQVANTTAVVLQIAGSASGVPGLGAAGEILGQIITACDSVTINKQKKAKSIKYQCTQLLSLLEEEQKKVDGTGSSKDVHEAILCLDGIRSRMSRVARTRSWELWKSRSLDSTLEGCQHDLDSAQTKLNIKTQLTLVEGQETLRKKTDSIENAIQDLRSSILAMVNSGRLPSEVEASLSIVESGTDHGFVQLMEAGQQGLRSFKRPLTAPKLAYFESICESPISSPGPSRGGSGDAQDMENLEGTLYNFHLKTGTLPAMKVLNAEITKVGDLPIAGGVYSDIWPGMWLGHQKVALKALRHTKAEDPRAQARFEREVNMWSKLGHEHILPFYGIVTAIGKHIHMVSPWQENGNILAYVNAHPHTNRLGLIKGAAAGLQYLHENKIVHGNVKCTNILVTEKGEACISDFGMSKLVEEVTATSASATLTQQDGSARWLAPELIEGTISSPTFTTDTYSFGMTVLELVTGKHPYVEKKNYLQVIRLIAKGEMPQRPLEEIRDDRVWQFLLECWKHEARLRPSMREVNAELEILLL